jgi:hypothetical protein
MISITLNYDFIEWVMKEIPNLELLSSRAPLPMVYVPICKSGTTCCNYMKWKWLTIFSIVKNKVSTIGFMSLWPVVPELHMGAYMEFGKTCT